MSHEKFDFLTDGPFEVKITEKVVRQYYPEYRGSRNMVELTDDTVLFTGYYDTPEEALRGAGEAVQKLGIQGLKLRGWKIATNDRGTSRHDVDIFNTGDCSVYCLPDDLVLAWLDGLV